MISARSGIIPVAPSWPAASDSEPLLIRYPDSPAPGFATGTTDFFRLQFSTVRRTEGNPAVVWVPLRPLGASSSCEIWTGDGAVEVDLAGGIGVVANPDHVLAHAHLSVSPHTDIAAATQSLYTALVSRVRGLRYAHLVRIWNFLPDINHGSGDDEVYARFNHGRAIAFDRLGLHPGQYPAATGIGGLPGSPFTVILLASRSEPLAIENPRQVSAYQYPRQYGIRSPAFARAMILPDRAGGQLFISGTASIVGHESQHAHSQSQIRETLANLAQLMDSVRQRLPGHEIGARRYWRVYLRNEADLEQVSSEVNRQLGNNVLFLNADICRRELQVEVEGVCELTVAGNASSD